MTGDARQAPSIRRQKPSGIQLQRRRELAVLRALGATRRDVRGLILGEALCQGLLAGGVGVLLARVSGWLLDRFSHVALPDFPYKPETFFAFSWSVLALGLGFSVGFSLLGALWPAHRAATLDPARALASD